MKSNFPEFSGVCGTLTNPGGRYSIYVSDVRGIVAPARQYTVLQWGQVDLQEYANGSFVSNNSIFTILFLNTYYHKQINKILTAAFDEIFRQSLGPVYAHTPIRNTRELRTFNPKLRTSPEAKSITLISFLFHYNDVTWASCRQFRATEVFVQQLVRACIKNFRCPY